MNRALYDLHLHTAWSYDASASAEAHFEAARKFGVSCIAITDHHCIDALDEVRRVAVDYPEIRWIRAAELSVHTQFGPIDLLCYGLPAKTTPSLRKVLDEYHEWQREYGASVSAGAVKLGFPYGDDIRTELLKSYRPERTLKLQGATHVQNGIQKKYFLEHGFIENEEEYGEFFEKVREVQPLPHYPEVGHVVEAVKESGGIVVIAHPFRYFLENDIERMDTLRDICQLDGIECAHPSVPPEFTHLYRLYCQKHDLVSTGGSDSHHEADMEAEFAVHIGSPDWLGEVLSLLESRRI